MMQETQPGQPASASGCPSSTANSFAKAVSGLVRRLLKSLGHSFGSSRTDREQDVSHMTIEFLYSRLQVQRTINKAEKQHVQQLLEKVVELEQKLNMEVARRKQAEHDSMSISSRYRSSYFGTKDPHSNKKLCVVTNESMKGAKIGRPIKGGMKTRDEEKVYRCCFCHRCGCHSRRNCQQLPVDEHRSPLDKHSSATDDRSGHETLKQKGTRRCLDIESCPNEGKASPVLEIMKENSTDDDYATDFLILGETSDNERTSLAFQNKPSLYHNIFSNASPRKAPSLWLPACNNTEGTVDSQSCEGFTFERASTEISEKCSAEVIHSHRDYHRRALNGIMSSPEKTNLGPYPELPICSPSLQQHSLHYNRHALDLPADGLSLHEDILVESLQIVKETKADDPHGVR